MGGGGGGGGAAAAKTNTNVPAPWLKPGQTLPKPLLLNTKSAPTTSSPARGSALGAAAPKPIPMKVPAKSATIGSATAAKPMSGSAPTPSTMARFAVPVTPITGVGAGKSWADYSDGDY